MLINFIKFIHLLCVLGLVGATLYCIALISQKKLAHPASTTHFQTVNQSILFISLLAMLTGTLLVHPKFFTFHTPWIIAAYLLVILFSLGIHLIRKKYLSIKPSTFSSTQRFLLQFSYLSLFIILVFVIHDAVTKTAIVQEILFKG